MIFAVILFLSATISPPLPLVPGDPLALSDENEKLLFGRQYAEINQEKVAAREFPWFTVGGVVLLLCILPLLLRQQLEKRKLSLAAAEAAPLPLSQKALLLNQPLPPKGKIALLESLLREWWNAHYPDLAFAYTLQEMNKNLPENPPSSLPRLLKLLISLEPGRFSAEASPNQAEIEEAERLFWQLIAPPSPKNSQK
jgi:hypothetical protein